jgi:hypothetical protein
MSPRLAIFLRGLFGTVIGAFAAIVILRIGDHYTLFGLPSVIEQPAPFWPYILPWMFGAGAAISLCAALSTLGAQQSPASLAFRLVPLAIVLVCVVQTLAYQGLLPFGDFLLGVVTRTVVFTLLSFLSIIFGMILGLSVVSVAGRQRRSVLDHVPEELRQEMLAKRAKQGHQH